MERSLASGALARFFFALWLRDIGFRDLIKFLALSQRMRAAVPHSAGGQAGRQGGRQRDMMSPGKLLSGDLPRVRVEYVTSLGRREEGWQEGESSVLYRIRAYFIKLTSRN